MSQVFSQGSQHHPNIQEHNPQRVQVLDSDDDISFPAPGLPSCSTETSTSLPITILTGPDGENNDEDDESSEQETFSTRRSTRVAQSVSKIITLADELPTEIISSYKTHQAQFDRLLLSGPTVYATDLTAIGNDATLLKGQLKSSEPLLDPKKPTYSGLKPNGVVFLLDTSDFFWSSADNINAHNPYLRCSHTTMSLLAKFRGLNHDPALPIPSDFNQLAMRLVQDENAPIDRLATILYQLFYLDPLEKVYYLWRYAVDDLEHEPTCVLREYISTQAYKEGFIGPVNTDHDKKKRDEMEDNIDAMMTETTTTPSTPTKKTTLTGTIIPEEPDITKKFELLCHKIGSFFGLSQDELDSYDNTDYSITTWTKQVNANKKAFADKYNTALDHITNFILTNCTRKVYSPLYIPVSLLPRNKSSKVKPSISDKRMTPTDECNRYCWPIWEISTLSSATSLSDDEKTIIEANAKNRRGFEQLIKAYIAYFDLMLKRTTDLAKYDAISKDKIQKQIVAQAKHFQKLKLEDDKNIAKAKAEEEKLKKKQITEEEKLKKQEKLNIKSSKTPGSHLLDNMGTDIVFIHTTPKKKEKAVVEPKPTSEKKRPVPPKTLGFFSKFMASSAPVPPVAAMVDEDETVPDLNNLSGYGNQNMLSSQQPRSQQSHQSAQPRQKSFFDLEEETAREIEQLSQQHMTTQQLYRSSQVSSSSQQATLNKNPTTITTKAGFFKLNNTSTKPRRFNYKGYKITNSMLMGKKPGTPWLLAPTNAPTLSTMFWFPKIKHIHNLHSNKIRYIITKSTQSEQDIIFKHFKNYTSQTFVDIKEQYQGKLIKVVDNGKSKIDPTFAVVQKLINAKQSTHRRQILATTRHKRCVDPNIQSNVSKPLTFLEQKERNTLPRQLCRNILKCNRISRADFVTAAQNPTTQNTTKNNLWGDEDLFITSATALTTATSMTTSCMTSDVTAGPVVIGDFDMLKQRNLLSPNHYDNPNVYRIVKCINLNTTLLTYGADDVVPASGTKSATPNTSTPANKDVANKDKDAVATSVIDDCIPVWIGPWPMVVQSSFAQQMAQNSQIVPSAFPVANPLQPVGSSNCVPFVHPRRPHFRYRKVNYPPPLSMLKEKDRNTSMNDRDAEDADTSDNHDDETGDDFIRAEFEDYFVDHALYVESLFSNGSGTGDVVEAKDNDGNDSGDEEECSDDDEYEVDSDEEDSSLKKKKRQRTFNIKPLLVHGPLPLCELEPPSYSELNHFKNKNNDMMDRNNANDTLVQLDIPRKPSLLSVMKGIGSDLGQLCSFYKLTLNPPSEDQLHYPHEPDFTGTLVSTSSQKQFSLIGNTELLTFPIISHTTPSLPFLGSLVPLIWPLTSRELNPTLVTGGNVVSTQHNTLYTPANTLNLQLSAPFKRKRLPKKAKKVEKIASGPDATGISLISTPIPPANTETDPVDGTTVTVLTVRRKPQRP